MRFYFSSSFSFNDPSTTEIYTLSLHDALPISAGDLVSPRAEAPRPRAHARSARPPSGHDATPRGRRPTRLSAHESDRKSTRLNSSHTVISYAVFCLKKKKRKKTTNKN